MKKAASLPNESDAGRMRCCCLMKSKRRIPMCTICFLQIMEEGRLTDSFGRHIDFKNVILIMTSNIGAELIKNQSGFGFGKKTAEANYEKMKEMLNKEVERHFRPEFINRLDDMIVFRGADTGRSYIDR